MATVNGIDLIFKTIPETTHKAIIDGADVIPFAGSDGKFYYITRDELFTQLGGITSGFVGALAIADTPTLDGMYIASESGPYTNAGGIVVDLTKGITFIVKTGSAFEKVVVPVDSDAYVLRTDVVDDLTTGGVDNVLSAEQGKYIGNTIPRHKWLVDGANGELQFEGAVVDEQPLLHILDKAIIDVEAFRPATKFIILKLANFFDNQPLGYRADIRVAFADTEDDLYADINTLPSAQFAGNFPNDTVQDIYLTSVTGGHAVKIRIDLAAFNNQHYRYDFNVGGGGYSKSGLRVDRVKYAPISPALVDNNLVWQASGNQAPSGYFFNKAIKEVKVFGQDNMMYAFWTFTKVGSSLDIEIRGCKYDSTGVINSSKDDYVVMRSNDLPLAPGINLISVPIANQTNTVAGVSIVIDSDELIGDFIGTGVNPLTPEFFSGGVSSAILAQNYHFTRLGYFSVGGDPVENSGYEMAEAMYIPEGAATMNIIGRFDANANATFMDDKGRVIGFGIDDGSGGKYSGGSTFTNPSFDIPAEARFVKVAVLVDSPRNYAVKVNGGLSDYRGFDKNVSADSIASVLYDNNYAGDFQVSKYSLDKKVSNAGGDLTAIETNYSSGLDRLSQLKVDGAKIIPSFTYPGGTITGGALCAVDKNGVMYFYNVNQKCIFKSPDGGETFEVLFDANTTPEVFNRTGTHSQARETIIPMDNGELLIPFERVEEIFSTDPVDRNSVYHSVWVTGNGQTTISRAFKFSYESYLKDLDPGDPQYLWPVTSSGAMLGHWTHDVMDNMIVITEYGESTSRYWYEQGQPGGNARGISGRAWVSFDYGITWKKMFDMDRKIDGNPANEADNNWFYVDSFDGRMMAHMHSIHIDRLRRKVWLTNGDGSNYLYSVDIDNLEAWYATAPAVDPEAKPAYLGTDTFPDWSIHQVNALGGPQLKQMDYNKQQISVMQSSEYGLMLGHDAPREIALIAHDRSIKDGDLVIDPTFSFEFREDYATDQDFENSKKGTVGFVQQITRKDNSSPFLWLHTGPVPRIWATFDGITFAEVLKSEDPDLFGFCAGLFFDYTRNKIYMNPQVGGASADAGYYVIKEI